MEKLAESKLEQMIIKTICEIKNDYSCTDGWIKSDMNIIDDFGLDSLQVFEFIIKSEEIFGIEFNLDELENSHFNSVSTFALFVKKHLQEQGVYSHEYE